MESAFESARNAGVKFGSVSSSLIPATASLYPVLSGVAASFSSILDVVKIEIIRDWGQVISVFFEGLSVLLPASFKKLWGNFSSFFSFCFSCWFSAVNSAEIAFYVYVLESVLAVGGAVWFFLLSRRLCPRGKEAGLEVVTWSMQKEGALKKLKYLSLLLTTLYLPVARDSLQVILCDSRYFEDPSACSGQGYLAQIAFLVVPSCLIYLIPIPIFFYQKVRDSKPTPSLYDSHGHAREGGYTDDDYRKDLEKNKSPFKFLFAPYERKWAFHKIVVMIFKVLVVLPAVFLVSNNRLGGFCSESTNEDECPGRRKLLLLQAILTVCVLGVYAFWSWLSRPYLDSKNDFLDAISRFSLLIIAVIGLIASQTSSYDTLFGIVLNVLTSLAALSSVAMMISGAAPVQRAWKNVRKSLSLTKRRLNGGSLIFSDEFSLNKARKERIWHEFWDVLFQQDPEYRLPCKPTTKADAEYQPIDLGYQYGNSPPYLLNFRGTIAERHAENKEIVSFESLESYATALKVAIRMRVDPALAYLPQSIAVAVRVLAGLDVFWNGPVEADQGDAGVVEGERETKPSRSKTHFGKLYIVPFPLCAVLVFDDVKEVTIFSAAPIVSGIRRDVNVSIDMFRQLVEQNMDAEVRRRRQIRRMLRSMSGERVQHFYQCEKRKTKTRSVVKDGKTTTESYSVKVLFTFKTGVFECESNNTAKWLDPATNEEVNVSHGFSPCIYYRDGEGVDESGQHWRNESHKLAGTELGITPELLLSPENSVSRNLVRFLYNNFVRLGQQSYQRLEALELKMQRYSEMYLRQFDGKESVLSYAFWYFVYNNDRLSYAGLKHILENVESNPLLKALPFKHESGLAMLFQKLAFFDSHPANAFWFVFWHDIWVNNMDTKIVLANKSFFDPFSSTSICYTPVPRSVLEERLLQQGVAVEGFRPSMAGFIQNYVNCHLLDKLYARMDEYCLRIEPTAQVDPLFADEDFVQNYINSMHATAGDFDISGFMRSYPPPAIPLSYVPDPNPK